MDRVGNTLALFLMLAFLTYVSLGQCVSNATNSVPCMFVFGDSLVDNGNNNGLLTLARANYRPYGIDFPEGASGRFTNGKTIADVLAQSLGFKSRIPSYASAQGNANVLMGGVNFASGAGGLRSETGDNLGDHYYFAQQVEHFRAAIQTMRESFKGNDTALTEYLGKCIYYVGMGSNDYLNNYFMPYYYTTSYQYTPEAYAKLLLQEYSRQLSQLYGLGVRKVAVVGLGQIGCIPYELARLNSSRNDNSTCNKDINNAISMYNTGLLQMVKQFNNGQQGAKFLYVNIFEGSKDLVSNAATYGFTVVDKGCCGVGRNNGQITCLPYQTPCQDRTKYLFWDAFHPTEAANAIYARKSYSSKSTSDVYPVNIHQLAMA